MADANQSTPPADGGNDIATLQRTVGELSKVVTTLASSQSELAKNVNTIADTITKLPPASTATAADKGKAGEAPAFDPVAFSVSIEQKVTSLVGNALKGVQQSAQRDAYLSEKLKDLPAVYRDKLGNDPTKWATEEQSIREQFKADLKLQGLEPKQLGNANNEGGTTPDKQPVDRSKMSPMDLLNSDAKR